MRRAFIVFVAGLLGIVLASVINPRRSYGQAEVTTAKLVGALRLLNTQEYSYRRANGQFAARGELLAFLQQEGLLRTSPIDLENPKPYELEITVSSDGMHYQITLQRPSDMHDRNTWCKPAAFSEESGLIYLGLAIGCKSAPK